MCIVLGDNKQWPTHTTNTSHDVKSIISFKKEDNDFKFV